MLGSHHHPDHPSRLIGLLAFFVGIAMLAAVFLAAYHLFTQPVPGLGLSNPPHGTPPPAASIGVSLAAFFEKILLLVLLTIVGSVTAGRGVHLCFAATHAPSSAGEDAAPPAKNGHAHLTVTTTPEASAPEKTA